MEYARGSPEWKAAVSRKVAEWEIQKTKLEQAKADETVIRRQLVRLAFNTEKLEGTESLTLADGRILKSTKSLNYKFKPATEDGQVNDAVVKAMTAMGELGPEGPFLASRLIKWEASLMVGEYHGLKRLPSGNLYKAILDGILAVTEATPRLEVVTPKGTVGL